MDIDAIRHKLKPQLDSLIRYEIGYVDNDNAPLLFILDFSPDDNKPLASFAFSLSGFENRQFESKCWCNCSRMRAIDGEGNPPKPHSEYKVIIFNDTTFHPFSVDLSGYTPTDGESITKLVRNLYQHIEFD